MTEQYNMIVIPQNGRYCQFQIDMEYFINICNYETMWKIAALLRDANQVDKSLLSTVTVFSSNFAFVYISNVILISLSRQENLSKDMNESNNELVLDELFYDLLLYVSQRWKIVRLYYLSHLISWSLFWYVLQRSVIEISILP